MDEVDKRLLELLRQEFEIPFFPRLHFRMRAAYAEAYGRTFDDPAMDAPAARYAWGHDRHALAGQALALAAVDGGVAASVARNETGSYEYRVLRTTTFELVEAAVSTPGELPQQAKFRQARASNSRIDRMLLYLPTLEPPDFEDELRLFGVVLHGPKQAGGKRELHELGFLRLGFPDILMERWVRPPLDLIPLAEEMESILHSQEQAQQQSAGVKPVLKRARRKNPRKK